MSAPNKIQHSTTKQNKTEKLKSSKGQKYFE
jgi:hypothetical protein